MFKLVNTEDKKNNVVRLAEMNPGDIGKIVNDSRDKNNIGEVVMRTFSTDKYEIMNLSSRESCTFIMPNDIFVKLFESGANMKCYSCKYQTGYTLGSDECGAGTYFIYCAKGHWEGLGEDISAIDDPWKNCVDFECGKYNRK